jgi:hypothetical protein
MPRRRSVRQRTNARRAAWAIFGSAVIVAFAAGYFLGTRTRSAPQAATSAAPPASVRPEAVGEEAPRRQPTAGVPRATPPVVPPGQGARVALVIDDLGRRVEDVSDFAQLGVAISYGVLPFESRTAQVVEALRRRGGEILCHLPMEPSNGADPGPGALTRRMNRQELVQATEWALDAIQDAVGVNNHMGSQLTADREVMSAIVEVLDQRRLFFLDSRTSSETVAYQTARELGLPAAERQVFLDPQSGPETVREQFARLLELARRRGAAIAIGHPHPSTLVVLREEVPRAVAAGYEFVPVSALVERSPSPG